MNLQEESIENLKKRRQQLEYLASMCALENVPIPDDIERDFLAVSEELRRRNVPADEHPNWTSYLGTALGNFVMEELLGEGAFSWVFRGVHNDPISQRAFKIAKPPGAVGTFAQKPNNATEALAFVTGGLTNVQPDAIQLLGIQARKLIDSKDPALINVEEFLLADEPAYYRMELVEGHTLREIMTQGPVPIQVMLDIARAMERLGNNPHFEYHGDLKPENILVAQESIKLIDPGYSGPIDCQEGNLDRCIVTTPNYYPLLTMDDLFALGIILWEAACDQHPLGQGGSSDRADLSNVGEDLYKWVRQKELVGQYFLSPLLAAGRPSQIRPGLPAEVEQVLLKAMRLRIRPDGKLDKDPGYTSFSELIRALDGLLTANIRQF